METTTQYEWIFDSNKCEMLGHRIGCNDVGKARKKGTRYHYVGIAATAAELDDIGHDVRMCSCTK